MSDSRAVLAGLSPGVRSRFTSLGIAYLQNLHGGFGLGKSWQDTYETGDRDEVERALAGTGAEFRWTDDDELRVRQVRPAVRSHPVTGRRSGSTRPSSGTCPACPPTRPRSCWRWPPPTRSSPPGDVRGREPAGRGRPPRGAGDGQAQRVLVPVGAGDVMMIDNLLVMHGRHAYTGNRRILVSMI
nr:hypothetical protein GCM10020093_102530 [Planobispora longispora]